MRLSLVLGTVGQLLSRFALAVLPSLVIAAVDGHGVEVLGFALGGAAALFFGAALGRLLEPGARLQRAENLAVVALTWLAVGLVGSVPFLAVGLTPIDAVFESVSGITTTGASVFTDFSLYGRGIFLWRAVLQWIGGLGVIALFVAILPQLGVAGRQLYFAEASSSASEPIAPRVRALSGRLWAVYTILTAAEIAILDYQGMPFFDAVCNAMATLAAGGFSPNGASIQGYGLPACEWTVAVFMFLAGANFALQWRMMTGRPLAFTQDPEFRVYAVVAALGTGLVALLLAGGLPTEADWRQAFFQVASVMSATGFASTDFNLWAEGARACLIFLMLFGGCAGSAAGGPKVVRYIIVAKHSRREMIRTIHPQAVMPVRLGRATVSEDVLRAVVVFVLVYLLMWGCVGFLLTILGLDMVSAYSGTLACLANCGPGLNALGPMANYEALPTISKAILVLTMWIGRLEVITVFALLRPDVLRRIRWR